MIYYVTCEYNKRITEILNVTEYYSNYYKSFNIFNAKEYDNTVIINLEFKYELFGLYRYVLLITKNKDSSFYKREESKLMLVISNSYRTVNNKYYRYFVKHDLEKTYSKFIDAKIIDIPYRSELENDIIEKRNKLNKILISNICDCADNLYNKVTKNECN